MAGITNPFDKEIIKLLCKEFSVRQIAEKLSTPENTVPKSTVYDHIIKLIPPDQD